jgi:hypothetical protein
MMRVDSSAQVMSESASYAALKQNKPVGAVGGVLQFTNRIQEEDEKFSQSSDETDFERINRNQDDQSDATSFYRPQGQLQSQSSQS